MVLNCICEARQKNNRQSNLTLLKKQANFKYFSYLKKTMHLCKLWKKTLFLNVSTTTLKNSIFCIIKNISFQNIIPKLKSTLYKYKTKSNFNNYLIVDQ